MPARPPIEEHAMPAVSFRRLTRTVASALLVTAFAAPCAAARPAPEDSFRPDSAESVPASTDTTRPPSPPVTRIIDDGFDLGSAAIGAGGGAAAVLLTTAGGAAFLRRRRIGVVR
jgi:hypothetical protein